jgi:ATP-dependent Clp protease ATP-binding subunit ClpA
MVDDALSLANSKDEVRVDTDHLLSVMAESHIGASGLLREFGITPKSVTDLLTDSSQIMRRSGTTKDYVAGAKAGQIKAVYFREDLLREIINIVTQSLCQSPCGLLIGRDVGRGSAHSLIVFALLMSEGKGPVRVE